MCIYFPFFPHQSWLKKRPENMNEEGSILCSPQTMEVIRDANA
jgi:hypothetical protein